MNCLLLVLRFIALLLHKERRRVQENHITSDVWKVMHLQLWKFLKFYFLDYYFLKMNESLTEPAKLLLLVSCYPTCSHYVANSLHSADSSDRFAFQGGIACKGSHHFEQCEVLPERYITKIEFHLLHDNWEDVPFYPWLTNSGELYCMLSSLCVRAHSSSRSSTCSLTEEIRVQGSRR